MVCILPCGWYFVRAERRELVWEVEDGLMLSRLFQREQLLKPLNLYPIRVSVPLLKLRERTIAPNKPANVAASITADPTLESILVDVNREFAFVVLASRTPKKQFLTLDTVCAQHITQDLRFLFLAQLCIPPWLQ